MEEDFHAKFYSDNITTNVKSRKVRKDVLESVFQFQIDFILKIIEVRDGKEENELKLPVNGEFTLENGVSYRVCKPLVERKRNLEENATNSTKPQKKTRTEPKRYFPPPYIYSQGLLQWNLYNQELTARDIPQVFQQLSPEARVLHLGGNSLGEEGATALADMLKTNSTLTTINLDNNEVGKWGGEALYASIAHNSHLKRLSIDGEWIPSEFVGMSLEQVRSFTTALEHG